MEGWRVDGQDTFINAIVTRLEGDLDPLPSDGLGSQELGQPQLADLPPSATAVGACSAVAEPAPASANATGPVRSSGVSEMGSWASAGSPVG